MLESHLISHLCLAVIKFLFGVLVNGIIVVVNDTHLIKQRKMIPLDLLVSCLAISRICLQLAIFYVNLAVLSLIEFPQLAEKFVILTFINESGLRFATWLSLFYCAKSATIAHPHFRLKMRISKWVPWLVLESPLYASSMDVFHSKHRWIFSKEHFLGLFSPNATTQSKKYLLYSLPFCWVLIAITYLPYFFSALDIFSGETHLTDEKHSNRPQEPSHIRAHQHSSLHPVLSGPLSLPLHDSCFALFSNFQL